MTKITVLTDFQLMTIFTDIEAIVNNQPLMLVTNQMILTVVQLLNKTVGTYQIVEKWKQVVSISNQFWKRWLIEYLPPLQSTRKWNVHQTNIEPGTIVLLKEENLPRGKSPLA